MSAYMSKLFPRSNSSFFLRTGNALEAKVVRLRDEMYPVDAGVGRPRIATEHELINPPTKSTTFSSRVGFLTPTNPDTPVKNVMLQRCFVDLVTGDNRTKQQATARFEDMIGQNDAAANGGEQPLLLPRRFRKQRAWVELKNMWRANSKVRGFVAEKVSGGYAIAIACYIAFLPARQVHVNTLSNSISSVGYLKHNKHINNFKKATISPFCSCWRRYSGSSSSGFSPGNFCSQTHPILQSSSLQHWFKNWQHLRKHKLTASTFALAVGFWPRGRAKLWLEKIGTIEPFSGNDATCWSNIKEEEALVKYKLLTGNTLSYPEFQVYGENNPENNWLAASPDGAVDRNLYDLPERGVLEVKCPFFGGDKSRSYPWKRVPLHYIPQAQGLMEILDRDWMDMYCWTVNGSSLFRIHRNKEYWDFLKIALSDFWWKHVQPAKEICNSRVIANPLIELSSLRPAPKHEMHQHIVHASKILVGDSNMLMREIHWKFLN